MNREPKCATERHRAIARVTGTGAGACEGNVSEGTEYAGGSGTSVASTWCGLVEYSTVLTLRTVGPQPVLWRRRCGSSAYRSAAL